MDPKSAGRTRINGSCNSRRILSSSDLWAIQPAPPPVYFKFESLQDHQQKSLSSLVHFTVYEPQNLFGLKERAYTAIGTEEEKEADRSEASPFGHSSSRSAGGGDAAECQQPNELPVSDNNSGNSTPRQRRKRRSAAERRESHRRRSAAVVNDAGYLANLLNGLPQHKQKHENDGENEPSFSKPFSPIPDHSEIENDEISFNEPPEPSVHAPGDEGEGEEVSDLFSQQFNGELMMEKIGCRRAEANSDNLMSDALLQNSFEHRRSISADHLLHGIGLRREMLLLEADQSDLADAIHIKMKSTYPSGSDSNNKKFWREEIDGEEEEQTEGEACGQKKQFTQPNLSHSPSIANKRPPVSRKSPLLAQIQKQQNSVNYNDPTCSPFSPSSKARCASSTTKPKENKKEGASTAEAGSLSGPEQSFQSGGSDTSKWEKEINKSSESHEQQLLQERKKKGNCKRRNSSVSTVSAPCTHSIPTTSNVLLNLVDRFVSKRQYSDSNLLTSTGNKPTFGESFGRRSFKWNLFWGRKEANNGKCKEEAVVVDDHRSLRRKSGDEEEMRGYRKKCDQRKTSSRLGTLMEDLETGEDKERKKKQFAEEIYLDNDKKRFEAALQLPVHNEHHLVRIRVNRSMEVEDKISCHVDGSTMKGANDITAQRFSLIGSCDLAKLEEAIELKTNGVRRATSLREKYRVGEEDSQKLELFLKKRGMRRREEEEESDENAEGEMNLEHFMLLRCSRQNPFSPVQHKAFVDLPISTEHSQQQTPHHSTKNLNKTISPQLNTAPLTMPRKKSYNLPRKSSINVHHFGTLKRKKGIPNAQLARRRSSYVTKAQVLMARNIVQKDEGMKEGKTKEDHGTGEKRATEFSDRGKSETIKPEVVVTRREKADMLTKQRGASVSSSSLRQFLVGSERKGSRGSKVAPKTNGTKGASLIVVEKERAERSKKRESKTNSAALLGTIWSIRPRRKKENNRSLANLFSQQNEQTFVDGEERTNADVHHFAKFSNKMSNEVADQPSVISTHHSTSHLCRKFLPQHKRSLSSGFCEQWQQETETMNKCCDFAVRREIQSAGRARVKIVRLKGESVPLLNRVAELVEEFERGDPSKKKRGLGGGYDDDEANVRMLISRNNIHGTLGRAFSTVDSNNDDSFPSINECVLATAFLLTAHFIFRTLLFSSLTVLPPFMPQRPHHLSARSRPGLYFDFRRPSLPNSVIAAREMMRSVESESPSPQPGSCISLLHTLREENGHTTDSENDEEEIELLDMLEIMNEDEEDKMLSLALDRPRLLSPQRDALQCGGYRSPSPREMKFLRRKQQNVHRRGSAQQQTQQQQMERPNWKSQTDLRVLEKQFFYDEEEEEKLGIDKSIRSWRTPHRTSSDKMMSNLPVSKSPSKKRRKSAIPQLDGFNMEQKMRHLVRFLKKKGDRTAEEGPVSPCRSPFPLDPFHRRFSMAPVVKELRVPPEGLPDTSANSSTKKNTTAQSPSSTAFSFDQIPDLASVLSPAIFTRSQLNNPRWDDLGIWEEEEPSWTAKFPTEAQKLDNTERKRQNIIYELMMTEKNHCQVLVLLRQVYQEGLIRNGILDKATVKKLVPDVLDILLDFHLNLLRRFRTRMETTIVRDISDIICDGFGDSPIRSATIQSYTAFCLSREHSYHLLAALIAQKAIVRKFFEFHESEYKDRSFKACMLLIAQRLTKYPILIEQILKYESLADQKMKMQKAHFAVKSFALEINDELLRYERKIQWEAVKKALEKGSTGKLIDPKSKQDFTYADLVEPVEEANAEHELGRKVHLVQRVFWRETMTSPDVELRLLLCDDIIVFLRPKGASIGSGGTASGIGLDKKELPLQFFRHNSHSGVLPLYNTLVKGENLRRKSLLLIVTDREQPDLIQLVFPTSPEMEQCVHAIKLAKTNAPKFVRLSKRRVFELSQRSIGEGTSAAEKEYQSKMDAWQRELEGIFATYSEDSVLVDYFEYRMTFFDTIRAHLCRCPFRHFTAGEEQQHKRNTDREKERLSVLLKAKFVELARKRNGALAHLVERAQRARDADLPSFFDDLYDLGVAGSTPLQSSSSSDEHFNQALGSSDSCENQTKMPEGGGKKKPRRVCTYHGHGSTEQKNLSSSSGSSAGGIHPIRRHTTVPAGGHHVGSSDEEDVEVDSEIRRLPLKMNPMSRKAATEIIRDNIRLRSQNDRLKKESALKDLQLVSLRSRRGPSGETPERLESLRQKQEELQAEKREFLTECERREGQFRAKCAEREEHLQRLEDELRGRAEEFARMKEELERLTMQKMEEATEESAKCQQTPNSPARTPTKATNAVMRINNTYCGAGPVPRPSTEQQLQHEQLGACSFRLPTPQLLDRRAVSQMELPRHLVVKTETKQADKVRKMRKN
uniref:DH domain-containing protein n=1 Tax=Globodera rostochiensis TaxID=31243 RepID=A0A914I849_GLORO